MKTCCYSLMLMLLKQLTSDIINKSIYKFSILKNTFLKEYYLWDNKKKLHWALLRNIFVGILHDPRNSSQWFRLNTIVHRSMQIILVVYMFIILKSMLLSFMSYFLNRICIFSCFYIWRCVFYHNKNPIFYIFFFTVNIIITLDSCKRLVNIV